MIEFSFQTTTEYDNPYTDVQVYVDFEHESGLQIRRPAFWDGNDTWRVRFSSPLDNGIWNWKSICSDDTNEELHYQSGLFQSIAYTGDNSLLQHGLLKMSPGKRSIVHADGTPFLIIGDTPWAIPFRATKEQVSIYARDRHEKGFNAALLMSLQPDMEAEGPAARNTPLGFERAFEDLSEGHINHLKPEYFHYMDSLMEILISHEIVPVYQPVFHGFGWKGKKVLGNFINPEEYVRYVNYLLARYGAQPAMWLLAGDNGGKDPGIKESGEMMEEWDAYQQPTGLHYNPCDDFIADWAKNNPIKHCMHYNESYQEEAWLDFQWAQTGHSGEHLYHKVERMYENRPIKASANGEPTYEGMNAGKNGLGWWQGEEAWMQWMSGGTMGVVYGAAALWQWKVSAEEDGWTAWASQDKSWREAMEMDGSTYVGLMGKILSPYNTTDLVKDWERAGGKPLLMKEGELYISYLNEGKEEISISKLPENIPYRWINPMTGTILKKGRINGVFSESPPISEPILLIIGENNKE